MKIEMRRELAREPFEQKVRKVGQLLQLAATFKAQRVGERIGDAEDVAWLKKARRRKLHYRPLEDVLADVGKK
jgi:hypothetical protein